MKKQKLYVVKKYIMATSASEALKKESRVPADDVWVDDDFKKKDTQELPSAIGFDVDN